MNVRCNFNVNNKINTNPVDIANCFNDYFSNIGSKLAGDISFQVRPFTSPKVLKSSVFIHKTNINNRNFKSNIYSKQ